MKNRSVCAVIFLTVWQSAFAQSWSPSENPNADFPTLRQHFYDYWEGKTPQKGEGYSVFKRWEWFWQSRILPDGSFPASNIKEVEWNNYLTTLPETEKSQSAANWTSMGPSSSAAGIGRVNCIAVDPNNSNTIFVGVPTGGLWKTTNGGTSWTPLTDNLTVLSTTAVAIDPLNTNTIYLGTGDGFGNYEPSIGVLKSTDGGTTWNTTGLSWNLTNYRYIRHIVVHPTTPTTVLAATSDGLYRTTNGGTSWTKVVNDNFFDVKLKPGAPDVMYAASDDKLYKSTNGGSTWTTSFTIPNSQRVVIAVTAANTNMVAAVSSSDETDTYGAFNGLYVSTNSGDTYTLKSSSPNVLGSASDGSSVKGQGWYDLCIAISPTDANLIFVGGVHLWKSTNGGTSWSFSTPTIHADKHALNWTGNTLFSGNDGGIYKSTNNGTSWTFISGNLTISQMYRLGVSQSDHKVITGLQDNGTKLRSNTGVWTDNIGGDGMECFIHPTNSNIMYGEWQYGNIRRSTNGGTSWTNIYDNLPGDPEGAWVTPFVMDPNNSTTIYAGYDEVYKSTNQGNTWTTISSLGATFDLQHIAVAPSNSNTIYACDGDQVYVTTNGGTNWSNVTGNLPTTNFITYLAVDPGDANTVYVTFGGYTAGQKVYRSTSGGTTWASISTGLPNIPANCVIVQPNSGGVLYLGMDVGVYRRDAGATSWVLFNTGLPNVIVSELEIRHSTGKLRACTYGRGLWESDLEPLNNTCGIPSSLSVTNLQPREGVLNWGAVNAAVSYNVDVRAAGDPNWFTFQGITGTSLSLVYFIPCTNYEYRVQAVCASSTGNYSDVQPFSIPGCSNYCTSYGIDTLLEPPTFLPDEWIENVSIGTINNTSGNDWGYNDYTNFSTDVTQGSNYTLTLTPGFASTTYAETWSVWVDWNKDNDFADAGEQVFTQPGSSTAVIGSFTVPLTASTGNTRMRVSMRWNTLPDPCGEFIYAEIEDYTINVQGTVSCNTPTNLSVTGITERTATLNWGAVSGASDYTVEIREQGSGLWNEIADIATNSYFLIYLVPCTNYEFRVKSVCASGSSSFSNTANFSTIGCNNYCPSYGEDPTPLPAPDEWIENVSIGSINNTSGNNWGYADFSNLSTNLNQGDTYAITLTPGFSASSYTETWSVWIDWNKDNDFEDVGELVYANIGSTTVVSDNFTVPATASAGITRMRVNMKWDVLPPHPCEAPYDYGEVEDYTVNVVASAPVLTVNPGSLNFPALGNSQTVTVTTNCAWSVTNIPSWLTVSPSSGAAGTVTLTVTANENTSIVSRNVTLTFTACNGQATQNLSVTQNAASAILTVNPSSLSFPALGNSQTVTVTTNCAWSVTNIPAWLSVSPSSGAAGTVTLTVTADENTDIIPRNITLTFMGCNGQATQNLSVTQNAASAILTVNPSSLNFPALGNNQTVTLTTNCDWSVTNVPAWLSVSPSSGGAGTVTLSVTASENTSVVPRNITLTFTGCNGQATQNLLVTQNAASAILTINPTSLTFPASNNSQTLTLTTNCDWSVSGIPTWLTVNPSSGAAGTVTLTVTASENMSVDPRNFTLTFTGCNGQATQNLLVVQNGQTIGVDDLGGINHNRVLCVPNPVSESAWFLIQTTQSQTVHLDILAVDGRIVTSLKNVAVKPGENTVPWQPRDLPAGEYLFRCFFEKEVVSGRIVVMR